MPPKEPLPDSLSPPCLTPSRGNLPHCCWERCQNIGNDDFLLHLDSWRLGRTSRGSLGVCVCVLVCLCVSVSLMYVCLCVPPGLSVCVFVYLCVCVCVSVCLEVTTNFPLCFCFILLLYFSTSLQKIISCSGWLLELQPLYPHFRQQREGRRKAYLTVS